MVPNTERSPRLYGRETECESLAGLVSGTRRGHGAVLVVRGEAGTGKTALLDHAACLAEGAQVIRAAGAEPEAALPYAGLHQLCGPMTGLLGRLAVPQRAALETVFGVKAGAEPDRFLVGLGILRLLTEAAAERPLICLVDDAQWLDSASAQALAFAGRRLGSVPAAVVFAAREAVSDLAGLPEAAIGGLRDQDARDLLAATLGRPLDEQVREQVVAETGGIPGRLLELRDLTPAGLAGGFGLPAAPADPIPAALERLLGGLPVPTGRLLTAAAADPTGDPALLWRAAGYLGVTSEAALPAAEAGLVSFSSRVVFRDRAVRSAVYQSASLRDRRAAHQALAQATDARADPDRRAWHRSHACGEPDEDIAADLERTAPTAHARGGLAASAAFLERAALMTTHEDRRAVRTLAAATAMLQAGEPGAVARLLAMAEPGVP
ncbi:MAG TPA: AAA family ATPase, partial [Trebonia sp.]|nr:AAA family ATPase [Trebonia sp.]